MTQPDIKMVLATINDTGHPEATCPSCGTVNRAGFAPDGSMVWWPNDEIGTWCAHAQGAYASSGVRPPQFAFR
jgi:hypothetical protein